MVEDSGWSPPLVSFAKVNLYLDVLGKRPDGYHEIVGLFQTIHLHDLMWVKLLDRGFFLEGNVTLPENNTLKKAYDVFREKTGYDFGLAVRLEKRIPMGSGLGGGSSNAATLLKFLGEKFKVSLGDLKEIASCVGSDVPFFLIGGTALVRGRGEIVEKVQDITGYSVVLFVPPFGSSTAEMYEKITPELYGKGPGKVRELLEAYLNKDYDTIRTLSYNVFEKVFLREHEEIVSKLEDFGKGAIVRMLTGSGSAFFAVYPEGKGEHPFVGGVQIGSEELHQGHT